MITSKKIGLVLLLVVCLYMTIPAVAQGDELLRDNIYALPAGTEVHIINGHCENFYVDFQVIGEGTVSFRCDLNDSTVLFDTKPAESGRVTCPLFPEGKEFELFVVNDNDFSVEVSVQFYVHDTGPNIEISLVKDRWYNGTQRIEVTTTPYPGFDISEIWVRVNGSLVHTVYGNNITSYAWDTTTLKNGPVLIEAGAIDNWGIESTIEVQVTVFNDPSPNLTAPLTVGGVVTAIAGIIALRRRTS